ncbi:hypothetical protein LLE95_11810 [Pediococcus acidilactici]|nr:hypothetical protein [Pediococcus acidilactici]
MKDFFSIKGVFSVRNLTMMALLAALDVVLARYTTIHLALQYTLFSL